MAQIIFARPDEPRVRKGSAGGGGMGQKLGAAIGGVAGAITGGPVGAVKGAATGASIGGTLGGLAQPATAASVDRGPAPTQGLQTQAGAVDRRLQEIQKNPHFALQQAKGALNELPANIQKEFAPTIEMALEASRRAQKTGVA